MLFKTKAYQAVSDLDSGSREALDMLVKLNKPIESLILAMYQHRPEEMMDAARTLRAEAFGEPVGKCGVDIYYGETGNTDWDVGILVHTEANELSVYIPTLDKSYRIANKKAVRRKNIHDIADSIVCVEVDDTAAEVMTYTYQPDTYEVNLVTGGEHPFAS